MCRSQLVTKMLVLKINEKGSPCTRTSFFTITLFEHLLIVQWNSKKIGVAIKKSQKKGTDIRASNKIITISIQRIA